MSLLAEFVLLNIVNVIIQTIKSLCTVKAGKTVAALVNAVAYGFYTIVVIYMVCDLDLWIKVAVVGGANLVGVFIVKWVEEVSRKDRLWKVEMTVPTAIADKMVTDLESFKIPHNYIPNVGKYTIFNCYCATQKESAFVKDIADRNKAKFFVTESKSL